MDPEELRRFARQFQDRMAFAAKPRQRPKLGLPLLTASHTYRAALEAAATARRELIVLTLERSPDATSPSWTRPAVTTQAIAATSSGSTASPATTSSH